MILSTKRIGGFFMQKANTTKLLAAILTITVGVLFLIWKGAILSVAMTVAGILLIVSAVLSLIQKNYVACVINAVIGVFIIVFGWLFVTVVLYILAAILLIYGILLLIEQLKRGFKNMGILAIIIRLAQPVFCLFIAGCLLFNRGGTIAWVFILSGIFLIVQGVLALVDCLGLK